MANLIQELTQNIDSALYLWESITLKELIDFYPIEKMAEVYTYLQIANDSPAHEISSEKETIVIKGNSPDQECQVTMRKTTFHRQETSVVRPAKKSENQADFISVVKKCG